jgi:cytochrome P450
MIGFKKSVVFSRDAGFLQYVLQKNQRNYTKSSIQTEDLAKYVGKGLLTSEGDLWKKQRRLIQPAFHKKQLANLLETMRATIAAELATIRTGTPFDIFPVFNNLAFQVVAKALFSGGVSPEQIERLQYITETAQKMLVRELRQPYLHGWFKMSGTLQKHLDLTEEARQILSQLVATRRNATTREDDLLNMLLDARYEDGNAMDERQLLDEILILFTAGHETTSNALTFTCELLARHTQYQELILEEVQKAHRESDTLMEFLKRCELTTHVIEESMRLYPPAYFIDRVPLEDDCYDGMHIERGTSLLFAVHEIHKNAKFWEEPLTFKPERFGAGPSVSYSAFYYPFGAGPRMCIGNNFAMYEMVLAVAHLVAHYAIERKEAPIKITPLITLKPKDAVLVFRQR